METPGQTSESHLEFPDIDDATGQQQEGAVGFATAPSNPPPNAREDNPFSFRHFLRRTQNTAPSSNPQPSDQPVRMAAEEFEASRFGGARPKTKARNSRQGFDSELKSPCAGLPDFVQDHLVIEHSLASNNHSNGYHIPDHGFGDDPTSTESPLDLPRNNSPIHAAGAMPIPLDIANLASSHMENDVGTLDLANLNSASSQNDIEPLDEPALLPGLPQGHEINNNENVNSLSQLPDFLSDGPMQQTGRLSQQAEPEVAHTSQPLPHHQSHASLMDENARLRHQLEVATANERAAMARIERLEVLVEEHRRRESEEASSLEHSMEQIETNLKTATQRAVQSEAQVAQLKKENRRLQDEVKSLQEALRLQYDEASPRPPQGLNQTAQELRTAASSAERSIRELLAGVEHLRVMASSLESMDRIQEVRPRRD